jgi:hypothetical protein
MSDVQEFLTFVVACGGAGAFIDFVIGKKGQQKARSTLEVWWIRFDDVQANNFGRKEAEAASSLLKILFGNFFSIRRLIALMLLMAISFVWWLALIGADPIAKWDYSSDYVLTCLFATLVCSLSISLTQWLCTLALKYLPQSYLIGFLVFVIAMAIQLIFIVFLPIYVLRTIIGYQ